MTKRSNWHSQENAMVKYMSDTDSVALTDSQGDPFIFIPRRLVIDMFCALPGEPPEWLKND